jgi:membrane fusion protein (multidrug efflux system)
MKANFFKLGLFILLNPLALFAQTLTTTGTFNPSSKTLISSQVNSRVSQFLVDVGSEVKKDQPIVILDNKIFQNTFSVRKNSLDLAKIEVTDAEINFKRMQKLWLKPEGGTPSITLKRFEEAENRYNIALINVKQAEENLKRAEIDLEETIIKAPFNGVITKKLVDLGESIPTQPVTHIAEIQSLDPLYLEFSIPQSYQSFLKVGSNLSFEVDGIKVSNNQSKIDLFYPSLDESTRALKCRAVISNPDKSIKPGSLAKIQISTSE